MSKHLSLDERLDIEKYLNQNKSFKEIGKLIGKNCTTISREVRNHYIVKNSGGIGRRFNNCIYRATCPNRGRACTLNNCSEFKEEKCPLLNKPPYVCNGCSKKSRCTLTKHIYDAIYSEKEYSDTLSETREGILIDKEEIEYLNGEYLDSITVNKDKIVNHDFSIGAVKNNNTDLATQILGENSYKWNGEVGLISVSDYINANSNQELCGTFSKNKSSYSTCKNTNWMYKSENDWWTLSPNATDTGVVWTIHGNGLFYNYYSRPSYGVRPAVFLDSSFNFSGSGTQSDPFRIIN